MNFFLPLEDESNHRILLVCFAAFTHPGVNFKRLDYFAHIIPSFFSFSICDSLAAIEVPSGILILVEVLRLSFVGFISTIPPFSMALSRFF